MSRPSSSCPCRDSTVPGIRRRRARGVDGNPLWDSGIKRADGFPFSVTLTTAGTYDYTCVVHASSPFGAMVGRVTVVAAPLPVGAPTVVGGPSTPAPALAPRPTTPPRKTAGDGSVLAISGGGPNFALFAALALAALVGRRLLRPAPTRAGAAVR